MSLNWITINPTTGTGSGNHSVVVSPNTGRNDRIGYIKSQLYPDIFDKIKITQQGQDILIPDLRSYEEAEEGDTLELIADNNGIFNIPFITNRLRISSMLEEYGNFSFENKETNDLESTIIKVKQGSQWIQVSSNIADTFVLSDNGDAFNFENTELGKTVQFEFCMIFTFSDEYFQGTSPLTLIITSTNNKTTTFKLLNQKEE